MADPEVDITALVAIATGRTLGTGLYQGPPLAVAEGVAADSIFVQAHRGERPAPFLGTGTNVYSADVEVVVRGPPLERDTARDTARELLQDLQQATRTALAGYSLALVVEGEPEYLYQDVNMCHLYAFSLTVQWVA